MKRFLALLLLWASPLAAEVVTINQFAGLNSDDSPLTLANGQTPDSENVLDDDGPGLQGRKGFVVFSTQTPITMWEFPKSDGTRYLIANVGTRLLADTGLGTFSVLISTVPNDRTVAGSVLGDRFYFADTLNGLKYWDSSSVFVATAALKVDKLVTWKGRLVAAGLSSAARQIFISKYLDGTNWTAPINPSDDDAATITVAGALDENIQALYASFKDVLVWFKKNSFGGIYGSRRSNFSQRTYSDFVGVASVETIRDCDGLLRWLGNNRKMWEFDGATFNKISEDIDNIFVTIAQGDSSAKANTQSSEVDFEAGTQSPSGFADTVTIPGSLTPKTSTYIDTSATDWAAGTCKPIGNCNTTTFPGTLLPYLFTQNVTAASEWGAGTYDNTVYVDTETAPGNLQTLFPDTFDTFRQGSGTKNVWTPASCDSGMFSLIGVNSGELQLYTTGQAGAFTSQCNFRSVNKIHDISAGATFFFQVSTFTASSNLINYYFFLSPNTTEDKNGIVSPLLVVNWKQLAATPGFDLQRVSGTGFNYTPSTIFSLPATVKAVITSSAWEIWMNGVFQSSGTHTIAPGQYYMYWMVGFTNVSTSTAKGCTIDNFNIFPQTFTYTGTYLDPIATSPTWATFSANYSGPSTPTFSTQVGIDTNTFDSAITVSSGSAPTSANKRYIKVKAFFNHMGSTSPVTPTALTDYTVKAFSTFTYTSRVLDTGFTLPVWAPMLTSTSGFNGGGTNSFTTQVSADGGSFDASVAASTYTKIGSANKRYIKYNWAEVPVSSGATFGYDTNDQTSLYAKSTGTWTSRIITIGSAITSWGPFSATINNSNGRYTIQMATSTNGTVFAPFQTISNNTAPVISTAPFVEARIIFDIDVATETVSVDDVTFNWTEGSTIRAASAYSNQRYWLAVAIGATTNNRILVYDKKKQWQRYNGINADAMTLYNSNLYFGNSTGIYQAENGYSDNGTPIASYFRTTTFAPNKLDLNSNFDYVYMTADPSDSTLTTTYQINGIPTNYSLGSFQMNSTTGFQNFKLPFSASEVQVGKNISFKWSVSGSSFWRISNGTLYHQPLPLPE